MMVIRIVVGAPGTAPKSICKGTGRLRKKMTGSNHQYYSIVKSVQILRRD